LKVALVGERQRRREAFKEMVGSVSGKLKGRGEVVLLSLDVFDDWLSGFGGDEVAEFFVMGQVASGVTLKDMCTHYVLDYGLMWGWMTERPGRMERYYAAQRGIADAMVSEVPGIAERATVEDVVVGKFQVDTALKVAAKWDKDRYGEKVGLVAGLEDLAVVLQRISERRRSVGVQERSDQVLEQVEEADVVEAVPEKQGVEDRGEVIVEDDLYYDPDAEKHDVPDEPVVIDEAKKEELWI
jgi:hypothetical protein